MVSHQDTSSIIKFTILYLRKSTDSEDRQVRSLQDQEKILRDLYEGFSTEEKRHPLKVMSESRSAYRTGRPVFNEIMDMIDHHKVARILVLDPTRLSRNHEDTGRLIQRLADGVLPDIVTASGKIYSRADTAQLFMLTLENTISWKDSADKGARVSIGMTGKAEEGGSIGPAPIGYINVGMIKGQKTIDIDAINGPKVKQLFMLASTGGFSLDALTTEANKLGLRTRPTKRHADGLPMQKTTLHQILRNAVYKGVRPYKGKTYTGKHVALIEPDVWERVQISLIRRRTLSSRNREPSTKAHFVMGGCLQCGVCRRYSMSPYFVKGGRYIYYECKGRHTECKNSINQNVLLDQLYEKIAQLETDDAERKRMRKEISDDFRQQLGGAIACRSSIERELRQVDRDILDMFAQREEAKRIGLLEAVDSKLFTLKQRKDELTRSMQDIHDPNDEWIDSVVRCFELVKMTTEAVKYGPPCAREAILKSIASNYTASAKILVPDWVSPFRERSREGGRTNWLCRIE